MTIRVMVLIDTLATGGAESVAVELARGLDRRRFSPHVVVTRSSGPLEHRLRRAGIPVTVLGRRRRLSPSAYRRARDIARRSDLIHAHKFASGVWGALLTRSTGTPLIVHEHNWSDTPSAWRDLVIRHWTAPVTRRFLCVTAAVADQISAAAPGGAVDGLANPFAADEPLPRAEARRRLAVPGAGVIVGIVARLRPEKNHELLLRAVGRLLGAGHDLDLCIIGDGPRREHLTALAADLGIAERVRWAGHVDDAGSLVSAFDVAVLCSRWEGLPLAALEAMHAGVPVVATAVGGLPDLVGGVGLLTDPDDVDGLATAIASLLEDPHLAARLSAAARQRVRERHDPAAVSRTVEQLYLQVAGAGMSTR